MNTLNENSESYPDIEEYPEIDEYPETNSHPELPESSFIDAESEEMWAALSEDEQTEAVEHIVNHLIAKHAENIVRNELVPMIQKSIDEFWQELAKIARKGTTPGRTGEEKRNGRISTASGFSQSIYEFN
jgi:dsRNA-specific ribonuclease